MAGHYTMVKGKMTFVKDVSPEQTKAKGVEKRNKTIAAAARKKLLQKVDERDYKNRQKASQGAKLKTALKSPERPPKPKPKKKVVQGAAKASKPGFGIGGAVSTILNRKRQQKAALNYK